MLRRCPTRLRHVCCTRRERYVNGFIIKFHLYFVFLNFAACKNRFCPFSPLNYRSMRKLILLFISIPYTYIYICTSNLIVEELLFIALYGTMYEFRIVISGSAIYCENFHSIRRRSEYYE